MAKTYDPFKNVQDVMTKQWKSGILIQQCLRSSKTRKEKQKFTFRQKWTMAQSKYLKAIVYSIPISEDLSKVVSAITRIVPCLKSKLQQPGCHSNVPQQIFHMAVQKVVSKSIRLLYQKESFATSQDVIHSLSHLLSVQILIFRHPMSIPTPKPWHGYWILTAS